MQKIKISQIPSAVLECKEQQFIIIYKKKIDNGLKYFYFCSAHYHIIIADNVKMGVDTNNWEIIGLCSEKAAKTYVGVGEKSNVGLIY